MDKTYAWVIKRDDGKYLYYLTPKNKKHNISLVYAIKYDCKSEAQEDMDFYKLQNHKIVKIEIREVEE